LVGPHLKIELACYQHDGSDRRCKHAQHQIVGVIYRFAFLFEPEGIRSTTGATVTGMRGP
jgi:hypothetical protein